MRTANRLKQKKTSLERVKQLSEVALIVGGGPGISASCARLFTQEGMKVAIAARNPEKSVMKRLSEDYGVTCYGCDAREPEEVVSLFKSIENDLGKPDLVVHNIDGRTPDIFRKSIKMFHSNIMMKFKQMSKTQPSIIF